MMRKLLLFAGVGGILSACAQIPDDAVVRYYLPRADIDVIAKQTLTCTEGKGGDPAAYKVDLSASVLPVYSADMRSPPHILKINSFSYLLNDVDMAVQLTSDDRLAGMNATETGKAEDTASGAASFAKEVKANVSPAAAPHSASPDFLGGRAVGGKPPPTSRCAAPFTDQVKDITVDYQLLEDFPVEDKVKSEDFVLQDSTKIKPNDWHRQLTPFYQISPVQAALANQLREIEVYFTLTKSAYGPYVFGPLRNSNPCGLNDNSPQEYVCLRNTADLQVKVVALAAGDGPQGDRLLVPITHYRVPLNSITLVPIPTPAALGKAGVKLTLDDAGGIKEIGYSKTSSLLEVFGAAAAVATIAATR